MTLEITLAAAFMIGLLGSVHCIGMCGGIVGMLTSSAQCSSGYKKVLFLVLYNTGRIISYGIAGFIAGLLGNSAFSIFQIEQVGTVGMLISGAFMMMLGLYLANWWRGLVIFETMGMRLWSYFQPITRKLLPIRSTWYVLPIGMVWGWLPCGLVYTTLVWALFSADPYYSAMLMIAFGAGTLPMLLSLGTAANLLDRARTHPILRNSVGIIIFIFGAGIFTGLLHPPHLGIMQNHLVCHRT